MSDVSGFEGSSTAGRGVSRRRLLAAGAWSVPVVTVAAAAPAMATSPPPGAGALEFDADKQACAADGACKNRGTACGPDVEGTYAFDFKVNATGPICIVITEVTISGVAPGNAAGSTGPADRVVLDAKRVTVNGCACGTSRFNARILAQAADLPGCVRIVAGDYAIPRGTGFFGQSSARMVVTYDVYDRASCTLVRGGQVADSGVRQLFGCGICPG